LPHSRMVRYRLCNCIGKFDFKIVSQEVLAFIRL
jgi:hypothetical protein